MNYEKYLKDKQEIDHFKETETNFLKLLIPIAAIFVVIMFFIPIFYTSSKFKRPVKKEVLIYQGDIITYDRDDSILYVVKDQKYYDVRYRQSKKRYIEIDGKPYNKHINIKYFTIENSRYIGVDSILVD